MVVLFALVLLVPVEFSSADGQSKESLDLLFPLLFGFGLGEYHQPYINSVSKWDKEIFCLLLLFFFLLLAAPPPPPRWDHKAKKEGTRQEAIKGVQPFKERSRLTRARKDLLCFKRNQRASPSRVIAQGAKIKKREALYHKRARKP